MVKVKSEKAEKNKKHVIKKPFITLSPNESGKQGRLKMSAVFKIIIFYYQLVVGERVKINPVFVWVEVATRDPPKKKQTSEKIACLGFLS